MNNVISMESINLENIRIQMALKLARAGIVVRMRKDEIQLTKPGEHFMEDRIQIGEMRDIELTKEELELIPVSLYSGFIKVEIWNKVGLTKEDMEEIKKLVKDVSAKNKLLRVYMWGSDDGGALTVDPEGNTLVLSYIDRCGDVELNKTGPKTEEEYWNTMYEVEW